MTKKTIQKVTGLLAFGMLLGMLALTQNAYAQSATQTMTPKQIVTAVKGGATVAFVDADGNVIWSSDASTAPTPALVAEAAKVVITTADGEVIEAPVVTNPQGRPVLMVDGHYLGLGVLLHNAGYGERLGARQHRQQNVASDSSCGRGKGEHSAKPGRGREHQAGRHGSQNSSQNGSQNGSNCNHQQGDQGQHHGEHNGNHGHDGDHQGNPAGN